MPSRKIFSRRFVWLPLASLLLAATGFAAAAPKAGAKSPPKDAMAPSGWSFRLKPKAFQKDPELAMTVITELTPEGLKRAQVSPEAPAYYGMGSLGLKTYGEGNGGKIVVPAERIKSLMQTALAENGYLTAKTPGHPPSLVLLYQWGLHGASSADESNAEISMLREIAEEGMDLTRAERVQKRGGVKTPDDAISQYLGNGRITAPTNLDAEQEKQENLRKADDMAYELKHSPELRLEWLVMNTEERQNLVQRAALVGGQQFAADLQQILARSREMTLRARDDGVFFPEMSRAPLRSALTEDPRISRLFNQAAYSVYFVIVVAYDFDDYTRGDRRALWKTSMTVNTEGVSMLESLPQVITAAAPYFGRQMSDAALLLQTIHRGEKVEIGPLRVIGQESEPPAQSEKK